MDDQLLLGSTQERVDQAMDQFKALGVDRVRVSAFWNQIAPSPNATVKPSFDASDAADPAYGWEPLDRVVNSAVNHGLRVMVSITSPNPVWASAEPRRRSKTWKPKPAEYALFAQAVASRYAPIVDHYGLYNEPNQGAWLTPQSEQGRATAPHLYRSLVHAAYPRIKSADPSSTVLVGELASSGRDDPGKTRPIRPLLFLRKMGCRDARFKPTRKGQCRGFKPVPADAIGHHPYAFFLRPDQQSKERDDAGLGDGRRLLRTLDKLTRVGAIKRSSRKPLDVFYTEYGYQTNPPDPVSGVSLTRQSQFLQQAAYIAWSTPRVRGINQFRLSDGAINGSGALSLQEFQSGLFFRDSKPKPSFSTFPNPLASAGGSDIWGQVRPGERHTVHIEYSRDGKSFKEIGAAVTTDERGYFLTRVQVPAGYFRFRYDMPGREVTTPVQVLGGA